MFRNTRRRTAQIALASAVCSAAPALAQIGTAFTYQGIITDAGAPANGVYDVQFRAFNAPVGGTEYPGARVCALDVPVTDGLFTVPVDFGNIFAGGPVWIEIRVQADAAVSCGALNSVTPLSPRQAATPTPNSLFSNSTRGLSVHVGNTRNLSIDVNGNVAQRSGADAVPLPVAYSNAGDWFSLRTDQGTERWRIRRNGGDLAFAGDAGSGATDRVRFGLTANAALTVFGTTTTNVLTITGGADIAEPFNIQPPESTPDLEVTPGMVVSIDPTRLGELRVSSSAYDTAVAGIVSGANGVNTGLTLTHTGSVADGKHPVALTGRVWVLADADANGPISPGNLLTTATTPGHAMRATDRDRSGGATLGKAMSSLESGRGYVLVLVNLH